jgi:hypothetical protein
MDGSSMAAAPSVMAFTHLAMVWEDRLMESTGREREHKITKKEKKIVFSGYEYQKYTLPSGHVLRSW